MNPKFICIAVCTFLSFAAFSQEASSVDVVNIPKVTFFSPGLSYELRVGKLQTLTAHAKGNISAYYSYSDYFGSQGDVDIDPAILFQYRYYYNAKRRSAKGKRTEKNSLNYIGPLWETSFTEGDIANGQYDNQKRRAVHSTGVVWGFQRNYPRRFSLDLNIGLGYVFGKEVIYDVNGQYRTANSSTFTTIGNFTLGFWLGKP